MSDNAQNKNEIIRSIVEKIYNQVEEKLNTSFFYGDLEKAYELLSALEEILPSDEETPEGRVNACVQMYVRVWLKKQSSRYSESATDNIKKSIANTFHFIDKKAVEEMVDKCVEFIYENTPKMQERDLFLELMETVSGDNSSKNTDVELKYADDDEYGLIKEKPMFVKGFGYDQALLKRLVTEDGIILVNRRLGSNIVEGISGPVDTYVMSTPGGDEYGRIYVCNYGSTMPTRAPKGYKLIGQ